MDDWLAKELEKIGVIRTIPYTPQKIQEILERMEDEGSIAIEVARIRASLEHDEQNIEALSMILKLNRQQWNNSKKIREKHPLLFDYVGQLYDVLEVVINRKPTTSMMLRKYVLDNSDPS